MLHAAIDGVDAGRLVTRALEDPDTVALVQRARQVDVIAAGKAAAVMIEALVAAEAVPLRHAVAIGPSRPEVLAAGVEWFDAGHPFPTEGSVAGGRRALDVAAAAETGDVTVVLLSGGGSALMVVPADGITLDEKRDTARALMAHGADIHELNTVRKHLSAIKGGQLAAAAAGTMLTLAVSDVVGDDLSVIASGPTVPDPSSFGDALAVLARRGGLTAYPEAVVGRLRLGADRRVADTPKPGDPRLARSVARIIGRQRGALDAARDAAASRGYDVRVIDEPVTGEARVAAAVHVEAVARALRGMRRPACVLSSGETTVTVTGRGKGGRNQEFACAMAPTLATLGADVAAASIGTDGIDGPTDAAGAIVDGTTRRRAADMRLDPQQYLDDNNTYVLFDRLGDLIRTGPTSTNVGDLQVVLVA